MKAKSARPLSHHFTKVTPLSKAIAFILFIGLPILAFFLGAQYGEMKAQIDDQSVQNTYLQQANPTPASQSQLGGMRQY